MSRSIAPPYADEPPKHRGRVVAKAIVARGGRERRLPPYGEGRTLARGVADMFEKFNRLLVTTDFSEVGDRALAHAFRIAADQGAHVVLCHVVESIARPHPLYAHHYPRDPLYPTNPDADRTVRHALLERTPRSGPLAIVPYATVVAFGSPAEEILRVAHQQEIDLIVLATHGRTGLKRALLGSVADRVVRLARCAVLVVR